MIARKNLRTSRRRRGKDMAPNINISLPPNSPAKNWRDAPLSIAVFTAIATGTAFYTLVLPLYAAKQTAEIEQNRIAAERLPVVARELEAMQARVWSAENNVLFSKDSPYPQGFQAVRIGDSRVKVDEVFVTDTIDREKKGYWSVKRPESPITDATYYFDESKSARIHSILFFVDAKSVRADALKPSNVLRNRLTETYGVPELSNGGIAARWTVGGLDIVHKEGRLNYVLSLHDKKGIYWAL